MIIGERSNGKTYAVLEHILKNYTSGKGSGAYIRRWADDIKPKRASTLFDAHVANGLIERYTKGEYASVKYRTGNWYLYRHDDELNIDIVDETPFCTAFSLSEMEHDKSTSYPNITTVLFDEFLTRKYYIPDEFVIFMNTLSTIIRHRDNVAIFMCANTVNKTAPYFSEMGLTNVDKMKEGTIDVYTYGETSLTVAVEYCASVNKEGKPSDKYFAFNNPKLQMITGGAWEMAIYPHLPMKYDNKDIVFTYFIEFDRNLLQCEVIIKGVHTFTYIHRKTTPLRDTDNDLIFSPTIALGSNRIRIMTRPITRIHSRIWKYFAEDNVYYQDNEVGEVVRNYLIWCRKSSAIV
jgi:hypothetical protein